MSENGIMYDTEVMSLFRPYRYSIFAQGMSIWYCNTIDTMLRRVADLA